MKQKESWKRGREHKQNIISKLYFRGHTYKEIGEITASEMGLEKPIPASSVKKELDTLRALWKEERAENFDIIIAERVAQTRYVTGELLKQYELSKQDKETLRTEQKGIKNAKRLKPSDDDLKDNDSAIIPTEFKQSKSIEKRLGNPVYLTECRKWLEREDKLLGLYQPENSSAVHINKESSGISIDLAKLPPELLTQVIRYLHENHEQ
jgi:hypothetical protein